MAKNNNEERESLTGNEILREHGPAGWLVMRLRRYSLLGWVLFFVVLVLHFGLVAISSFVPRPVVAVDESGRVLGALEYLSPSSRSDGEIIAACKRFASGYMSLNADTIFDDYADAMNMMGGDMLAASEKSLAEDNYLARVKETGARSRLEFNINNGATVVSRQGLSAACRLVGNIVVDVGSKDGPTQRPFDVTFTAEIVARNSINTAGLKIVSRKDN